MRRLIKRVTFGLRFRWWLLTRYVPIIGADKFVLMDATIIVDNTDLSERARSVTLDLPDDEVDASTFKGKYKEFLKGPSDATWSVEFFNDFDSGQVDDVLWPLKQSGDPFVIQVRALAGAQSATNPEYRMIARLFNYSPIAGAYGEASTTSVDFRNADQRGVTRHPS